MLNKLSVGMSLNQSLSITFGRPGSPRPRANCAKGDHEHCMGEVHWGNSPKGCVRGCGRTLLKNWSARPTPGWLCSNTPYPQFIQILRSGHIHNSSQDSIEVQIGMTVRAFEKHLPPVPSLKMRKCLNIF